MDMHRRDFLKALGLGTVALTLPQPLKIVAAKMEDLKRPPLHVGYVETMPAKPCGDGGFFVLHNIGVRVERGISPSRFADYAENWYVAMFLRKEGDRTRGIKYLQARARCMAILEGKGLIGEPYPARPFVRSPIAFVLKPDDVVEFWFVPTGTDGQDERPTYPLPKLQVVLHGTRHYAEPKASLPTTGREYVTGRVPRTRALVYWHLCDVQKVLLDRARAIELGLVSDRSMEFAAG